VLVRGAIILSITSGLSYILGLLRDRVLAGTFGASDLLDTYQASFIIPDFLFNLLIAGALSTAFIPIFTDLTTRRQPEAAAKLTGTVLSVGLLVLIIATFLAFILADPLTTLVAPGFHPVKHNLHVTLTRIMLLSPLIFLVSNLLGSMLVSNKRFLFYGLSPALYNLGIIIGALILAPSLGITGVAIGTLLGATFHLLIRLIDIRRANLSILPSFKLTPEFKKVIILMIPRMIGLTAIQAQLWAFVAIASTLGEGAVTVYSMARNFQSFPVSLIGIAFATSLFPLLSESSSLRSRQQYYHQLKQGVTGTLIIVLPAAVVIYLLRTQIIAFFIGTGQFDQAAIARTAVVLGVYAFSIPTESLVHILARAFYALHNTLIPVLVSLAAITISITSAILLSPAMDVSSIPAGFAIGTGTQTLLLLLLLPAWSKRIFSKKLNHQS
jgi:putative peptidoglycan lipid II flippase